LAWLCALDKEAGEAFPVGVEKKWSQNGDENADGSRLRQHVSGLLLIEEQSCPTN
jgi:hypothetical protein